MAQRDRVSGGRIANWLGADMGCEPRRLSSIGPRRGATSRARAGCKFVLSRLLAPTLLVAVTAFAPGAARAQDATWLLNPTSGNFNTAANWNPATVPTGTAFFGTSNITALTFSAATAVGGWTFNAGASAYTFTNNQSLSFNGAGIVINGGSATIINTTAPEFQRHQHGRQRHHHQHHGSLDFIDSSTAGNATINNNVGTMNFRQHQHGRQRHHHQQQQRVFRQHQHGRQRHHHQQQQTVFFSDNSTAGNAAITNTSGASVDFSGSTGPAGDHKLTAGSIAGAGSFLLGANELTVGGNNLSTDVSGVISGTGSLVKVGAGTLTLSGNANLGGTTIDGGTLAVNGGTLNASNTIILGSSAGSSGTLNIGAGGSATTQNLIVGQSGVGTLAVQNGGTLTDFGGFVGDLPGSQGTATVSGAGSTWTNTDTIQVGGLGTGTLTIENGGTVNSGGGGSIGLSAGSTGTVTVTGPGSTWNNSPGGGLNIGSFGTGTLTIANGGMVINNTAFAANIGNGAGSQGTVTVTGAGSTWSNSSGVNIGNLGTGTLTIADGGIVNAGPIVIATNAGAIGTLNIGAGAGNPAAAPGTLTAPSVAFGAGTGTLNFNHTSANYVFAPAISGNGTVNVLAGTTILTGANTYSGGTNLVAGTLRVGNSSALGTGNLAMAAGTTLQFAAANLSLANTVSMTGDPIFDTMGNNATLGGVISGAGATLEKNGAGTLTLTAINTYTGPTNINAGTLAIGGGGSIAASSGVNLTAGGSAFDISAGGNQTIGDLSGVAGSAVTLGGNTLTAGTANSSTFAGTISGGTGALTKQGTGTLTLTGANSYSGGTNLIAGTLAVGNNSALGTGALAMAAGTTLQAAANGLSLGNAVSLNGTGTVDTQANALTLGNTIVRRAAR